MKHAALTLIAAIYAGVMLMGSGDTAQALSLAVEEDANSVGIELVALSPVTQRVTYKVELTGGSTSRHKGSTTIRAQERQVLSRMRISYAADWCALVEVAEESGPEYTLKAGNCREA